MVQKAPKHAASSRSARAANRPKGKTGRTNNADASRAEILAAATREFSEKGLSGARVDEIAERTQINKRMIYYYFDSKEGLYRAVLERSYGHIRMSESAMELDVPEPRGRAAPARAAHIRLSQHASGLRAARDEREHSPRLRTSDDLASIKTRNRHVLATLRGLLDRGIAAGAFRADIEPIELHMSISALCFYNVSNRYTFSRIFDRDMSSPEAIAARREVVVDMIMRWCAAAGAPTRSQRSTSSR